VKWQTAWQLLKDIALTGTGLAMIISQIFARQPSDVLLVTGLALTIPSVASHAGTLLSAQSTDAHGLPPSSPSSSPPGSPPSSPPQDGQDEAR
jgi:hypothetical protein